MDRSMFARQPKTFFNREAPLDFDLRSDGIALIGNTKSPAELNAFIERLKVLAEVLPGGTAEPSGPTA